MATIELLSEETIDKIAAGEVVERPASIVKELVENSIDAGASSITVEIKDGGISFIRVSDNGCGIPKDQIKKAFFRHATSKLRTVADLDTLCSLGFRGEALSSISAISQVEIMTKTADELVGTRYVIEGAVEKSFEDIGIPNGTTIIIRNVFYNTPVRRKFLKTSITEGGYISDVCEHLALSSPDIAFKFVNGGQLKFNTSGDGDLKEVIYRIYGKEVAKELIPVSHESHDIKINGYLGKPILNRANRNFEKFFVNGRYVKSSLVSNAVETGYKQYLMQHKFPMCILNIDLNTSSLDVNVHPTKMEIRFNNEDYISDFIETTISSTLKVNEMIPEALLNEEEKIKEVMSKIKGPEPFEVARKAIDSNIQVAAVEKEDSSSVKTFEIDFENNTVSEDFAYTAINDNVPVASNEIKNATNGINIGKLLGETNKTLSSNNVIKSQNVVYATNPIQLNLFEEKIISQENLEKYQIIGQVFDTYWLFSYEDKLLIMDQHAAHEKIKYEHIMDSLRKHEVNSQVLNPPIIISLTNSERNILDSCIESFNAIGYEIDEFGGDEIAIRSVPLDLYGLNEKELFLDILDELSSGIAVNKVPEVLNDKIATMACKSAVKGNTSMTVEEVKALLKELMTLDNPYNCPHGRPTVVTMSKYEMDKKFKRIV